MDKSMEKTASELTLELENLLGSYYDALLPGSTVKFWTKSQGWITWNTLEPDQDLAIDGEELMKDLENARNAYSDLYWYVAAVFESGDLCRKTYNLFDNFTMMLK